MMERGSGLMLFRVIRFVCPILAAACLSAGLAQAGQERAVSVIAVSTAALLSALAMILTCRWPFARLATYALVVFTVLAAYGLLAQANALFMLVGVAAGLAGWDLALEEIRFAKDAGSDKASFGLFERSHLRSLALAVGGGLLGAAVGQNIQVRLPFLVVALLVGVGVWALERVLWEVNR